MKNIQVGIMGFGTVGTGVYRILTEQYQDLIHRENLDLKIKCILDNRVSDERLKMLPDPSLVTDSFEKLLNDQEITIVFECMGGTVPAREYILKLLEAGKTIVTSNKEVMAKHWPEFEAAAKKSGAGLYFEATAGGGIPIVRTLLDAMQGNNIELLMGIVNGTTNYILTKMAEEDASYEDVLKEAQALGYAEANPEADVDGWDCVYKLSILGSMAFHARIEYQSIYREGISKVSKEDMAIAKELGYVIKLLAIGKKIGGHKGNLQLRVHPTMIPVTHPLAAARGVFNAVFIHGNAVDDLMLLGRGAGQMPTASAMVSDAIYATKQQKHAYMTFDNTIGAPQTLSLQQDWLSGYCVRLRVQDQTGVLSDVARAFADNGVSIHSMIQRKHEEDTGETTMVIITHTAKELSVQATIATMKKMSCIIEIESLMRVER